MLGKACNGLRVAPTPACGPLVWRGLRLMTHLRALMWLLSFCGAAGQCTMCQESITGDWTYWDADCGAKIGNKCLSDVGDWMTWDACCSAGGASSRQRNSQSAPGKSDSQGNMLVRLNLPGLEWVTQLVHERPDATPLDPNSIVGLSQVPYAMRSCDCSQVRQTGLCSLNATSECSEQCCIESSCECSWARFGCGSPDGSRCWDHCCIQTTEACNCSFARGGGCGMQDHSGACWNTCCAAYARATSVWGWATQKLHTSVFSLPLAGACIAALGVLLLNARRLTVAIGHVTAKAAWQSIPVDAPAEDMRGLLQ
mmetsp:Transcript_87503/g.173660  ORF Transcript_87503/g.173660 Transcript_87503/m.173660 type:complete len:312 (+) Transcript_87503:42-977(+)